MDETIGRVIQRVMNHEGENPTRNPAHWKTEVCLRCQRHVASRKAFRELTWGQGTNLCWEDCQQEAPDVIPVPELLPLIQHYLELVGT